jgi:hypothetical protein
LNDKNKNPLENYNIKYIPATVRNEGNVNIQKIRNIIDKKEEELL